MKYTEMITNTNEKQHLPHEVWQVIHDQDNAVQTALESQRADTAERLAAMQQSIGSASQQAPTRNVERTYRLDDM